MFEKLFKCSQEIIEFNKNKIEHLFVLYYLRVDLFLQPYR